MQSLLYNKFSKSNWNSKFNSKYRQLRINKPSSKYLEIKDLILSSSISTKQRRPKWISNIKSMLPSWLYSFRQKSNYCFIKFLKKYNFWLRYMICNYFTTIFCSLSNKTKLLMKKRWDTFIFSYINIQKSSFLF